jgi:hypothetical protein
MPRQPSLLAYLCTWNGSAWKCGCRDRACTQSSWQIQSFQKEGMSNELRNA